MASNKKTIIIRRRCDKPMRRSKESAENARGRKQWKCDGRCKECFCCIEQDVDGFESHVNPKSQIRKRDDING